MSWQQRAKQHSAGTLGWGLVICLAVILAMPVLALLISSSPPRTKPLAERCIGVVTDDGRRGWLCDGTFVPRSST
jgi:hypothetical protein